MEKDFLKILFETLEDFCDYVVIRNYETLPETVVGTDVDIIVKTSAVGVLIDKLSKAASGVGYRLWKSYPKIYGTVQVSFVPLNINNPQDVVRVDLISGNMRWQGVELLQSQLIWDSQGSFNGIWVLKGAPMTALTLLTGFLYGGNIKDKYQAEYTSMSKAEQSQVDDIVTSALGRYSKVVLKALKAGDLSSINKRKLRRVFKKTGGGGVKVRISAAMEWTITVIKRAVRPPGRFVVLVGPDGSGKSAAVDMMTSRCVRMYSGVTSFHLYPKVRLLSVFDKASRKRWEKRQGEGTEWELRNQHYPLWKSIVRVGVLLLRLRIGYLLWVYPRLMKGHLVIGERWSYDLLVDPASKGIELPYFWRKVFFYMAPRPQKTIALTGSPEEMARRKKELPTEEVQRQIRLIEGALKGKRHVDFVDTTTDKEETFTSLLGSIVK